MKHRILNAGIIVLLLGTLSFLGYKLYAPKTGYIISDDFKEYVAKVYYSPDCGCCANYIKYLKDNGFKVETVTTFKPENVKYELGIPSSLWSCHTTIIGSYFIEGHMPVEAIKKLLEEKPEIEGIALPGMPSGSPGMSGRKNIPFQIFSVAEGQSQGIFEIV